MPAAFALLAFALPPSSAPVLAPVLEQDLPEMEYTYIEANYLWTDSDALDDDVDGFELTGSLELPLNFFGQITASHQSADADLDAYRIGAGYHLPLGSRIDAYGLLSFAHVEADNSGNDFDDDGVAGELGVRMMVTHKIEVNGRAQWVNVDDDQYGVGVGARYYLMSALSVGGRVDFLDEDESFAVGLRLEL
jgi:hypothetical protein